jgi:uncharacterized protein YdiU (UPF0061 family)
MAYAGHQFGHINPQLGDGRAICLGELDLADGGALDFQLKGSGPTRYSRNGDGRAALGPVLREYLVREALLPLFAQDSDEAVIRAAENHNDFAPFHALHDVLQNPFQRQEGKDHYMMPPAPHEVVLQTFCGT